MTEQRGSERGSQNVTSIDRVELEQLAEKIHQRHLHLGPSWRDCPDVICVRIQGWLGLLNQDPQNTDPRHAAGQSEAKS